MRKLGVACLGCLFTVAATVAAAAECPSVWGAWTDNYSNFWMLSGGSNPAGAVVVSPGSAPECAFNWDVGGTVNNGSVTLTASNPYYPYPDPQICELAPFF